MPNPKNQGRLAQDMKRELIGIVGQMKDPRLAGGLLTITRLEVRTWIRPGCSSAYWAMRKLRNRP